MSLRQKLLLLFSLTGIIAVATVGWTVSLRVRKVFDRLDQEQTAQFAGQFQREFDLRARSVAETLDRIATSERVLHMAQEIASSGDGSPYVTEAAALARENHLDYLEIVGADGNIISSAQWPARFGYREPAADDTDPKPFLKPEELPESTTSLGFFAVRSIAMNVKLVGGRRLDEKFLAELPVPAETTVYLYRKDLNAAGDASSTLKKHFDPSSLTGVDGEAPAGEKYMALIDTASQTGRQAAGLVYLTAQRQESVNATAIPLKSKTGQVLAALLIVNSRSGMVEVQQHIRAIAFGVAAGGILFAIAASLWIAARISAPIERLATAAHAVAEGNWETRVEITSRDEIGVLGESFNHMTTQLVEQREKLVQTERVAAWRELARRLAHELKNPLFPLQLTVENLIRARALGPVEFDEVFRESTHTLGMEIANLKAIIGRFSDFSKMPKPQVEPMDAKDAIDRVYALYAVQRDTSQPAIEFVRNLAPGPLPISADSELLHRALSNLVLNAMDAMPDGGRLTLGAARHDDKIRMSVADNGAGMTPEERERIFTPYYTTKEYGTGLGLAIVQAVVADHHGTISVEGDHGGGTTFLIDLPAADAGESKP